MVPSLLKLELTQGPRAGESLEFKPGSTIRIGRIVRGNEIAIKDAGISTKHLRIVSDSHNWIIHDLGSSNGTILNSDTLDPDSPINLRHGDVIKLGEYTSIVVNFVADDVQAQEHKLPPRPRRNNKRLAVADPDPDPIESVQEKPTRKGSSSKQDEHELPKRTRASRKITVEDIADKEKELEVENEKKVKSRVGRPRKQATSAITKEEEVPEEKKGNSRVRRGKNCESVQKLGLDSIKMEVEDTPKVVEISEVKSRKRVTRSEHIENAGNQCFGLENTAFEEKYDKRTTRATRSKKTEIGEDSFLDLEMVLNQARKTRAKRKKMEQELSKSVVEMEARNDDAGEEAVRNCQVAENKENEAQESCSQRSEEKCDKEDEREGDGSKKLEQVEIEVRKKSTLGIDDLNGTIRVGGETENLQDMGLHEEDCRDTIECKSEGAGIAITNDGCDEEKVEGSDDNKADETECYDGSKRVDQIGIELSKSTVGEEDLSCIVVREDGETENLQEIEEECHDEERECKVDEAGIGTLDDDGCDEEKVEQRSSDTNVERVEVGLGKMIIGEWFELMEVQLPKEITEETEKMIEPMRSKTLRVHKHIAEQKEKGMYGRNLVKRLE